MSKTEHTAVTVQEKAEILQFDTPEGGQIAPLGDAIYFDMERFNQVQELAKIMASGKSTIPKHLQGNEGDCFAVISQAFRWRMDPFAVAQKTHLVNGTLGYEAQLVVAALNASGLLSKRLDYEWSGEGDELEVKVIGFLKGEDKPRIKPLKLKQVTTRNSPLWKSDPSQQLAYLAAKYWSRLHCPDVTLGVYSPDELQDVNAPHYGPENAKVVNASTKMAALEEAVTIDDDGVIKDEQTADYEPPAIGVPSGEKGPDWEGFADAFIEAIKAAPNVEAIKDIAALNKAAKDNCFKQNQPAFKRIYEAMKELGAAQ